MTQQYLLHQAAALTRIRGWRIIYAIQQGYLPDTEQRFNRQRVFTDEDIARIRTYFANKPKGKPPCTQPLKPNLA